MKTDIAKRIAEANKKYGWSIKLDHNGVVCLCDKRGSDYNQQLRTLWPEKYDNKQLQMF